MKKRHRREDLVRLLKQRAEEGLTYKELAERSGVPVPTLGYWASKLKREREEESPPTLARVDIVDGPVRGSFTIEFGERIRMHIEPGSDVTELARVVRMLAAQC